MRNGIAYGEVRLVLDARAQLAECPLWSVAEQKLYWVDISGCSINRFDPETGYNQCWPMPCEPGCIGLAAKGGLVAALRDGYYRFYPESGQLEKIAEAPYDTACMRFNDGRCDALGRFWAGVLYEPRTREAGAMYSLERGQVRMGWGPEHGLGVKVSNGLAFSADGKFVFQSDTPNQVIYQFSFVEQSGSIGARSEFVRSLAKDRAANYMGRPDGAAIDSEGHYWSAQYEGGCLLRYSPQGKIAGCIRLPVRRPTMLAFGGKKLSTLYITTARAGASPAELADNDHAGGLYACEVAIHGCAEPVYVD